MGRFIFLAKKNSPFAKASGGLGLFTFGFRPRKYYPPQRFSSKKIWLWIVFLT